MKSKVIWALAALNVLLVLSLVTPLVKPAGAQTAGRPSDYLMIPGEIVGGNNSVVWVIDGRNQLLSGVTLNQAGTGIDKMAPMDLKRVFPQ